MRAFVCTAVVLGTASALSTTHGVVLPVGKAKVELAVASLSSFRVSVSFGGAAPRQLDSPMIAPQTAFAKFDEVSDGAYEGIKTAFGAILVSAAGGFKMLDAAGAVLTETTSGFATNSQMQQTYWPAAAATAPTPPTCDPTAARSDCGSAVGADQASCEAGGCCWSPVSPNPSNLPWCFHSNGAPTPPPAPTPPTPVPAVCKIVSPATDVSTATRVGALKAADQNGCCGACDALAACESWIWASNGDVEQGDNCWLMKDVQGLKPAGGRVVGGKLPPTPAPTPAPASTTLTLGSSTSALYYGAGASGQTALSLTTRASSPYVDNRAFMTPHYHSTDGYSALGVSLLNDDQTGVNDHYPAAWTAGARTSSASAVTWTIAGTEADLYLMPGASLKAGTSAYYEMTGAPKVLPRHAYGFMACRWGWDHSDRPGESAPDYMKRMLGDFRSGSFPIDSFISDFEWYTDEPDYNLPQAGTATFTDFWFNNVTFPDPVAQLAEYAKAPLNVRFGGIRKPRLGNTALLNMARSKSWLVGAGSGDGGGRNLNYSRADVQEWYGAQQLPLLKAGVEYFWNDEGETSYFTFHWWNVAQMRTLKAFAPTKRFLTINRAFTPGMSRMGTVIWTGDVSAQWGDLQATPGYVLNWGLAGAAHVTCDTGGFNGETNALLLTRWMQAVVFIPVMRVHSTRDAKPHFPFLWGDDAAAAMREALNLRYRLVPYHYSNAHTAYGSGVPMVRPLAMDFEGDAFAATLTREWMDGDALLAAPVLNEDNSTEVYLPAGSWFTFGDDTGATKPLAGPSNLTLSSQALTSMPLYARAGSIVPLAPVVQRTDLLPNGALEVRVYGGADANFTMVEDDGETDAYIERGAMRTTTYSWDDASATLSWSVAGAFSDEHTFTQLKAAFFPLSGGVKTVDAQAIGASGKVTFK